MTIRVLNLEDVDADTELIRRELKRAGLDFSLRRVQGRDEFAAALAAGAPDVVISDHNVPQFDGRAALDMLRAVAPEIPFILFTGSLNEEAAVGYMKAGAADYILKDRIARLGPAVQDALRRSAERRAHKLLEEQLRQAQKLEAIGQLAGGVAHDFNNILTAILGTADLLLADMAPADPRREDAEEIRLAARRAAALTRQLLAFSRHAATEKHAFDLNQLVKGLESMLRRLLAANIEIRFALGSRVSAVLADPGQIEQVVLNLAVNARDAMPRGGKLTIETADAELDATYAAAHQGVSPGRYVMLAVSDTGVGMDAVTQARIFQPFFTTKEPGKGTGLGLSTVDAIVRQHGGHVWLYSEPRKGTVFKVYLPPAPAGTAAEAASPLPIMQRRGTETILVVEDTQAVRALVARVLEGLGYTVLEASDASMAEVVAARHQGAIDLLLTDVVMPGDSGPELAQRLATVRPALRVVYTSGYTDEAVVHHGVVAASAAYLQKPFTPEALARKVRDTLDQG